MTEGWSLLAPLEQLDPAAAVPSELLLSAGLGSGVGGSLHQRPAPGPAGRCCRWTRCRTTLLMSPTRWQNAFYVYYAPASKYLGSVPFP